jgi:exodeoxyribonuclease VII small subunit
MVEKKQTFEDSMGRLEKIVAEMESGNLDLEQMIGRFEEGQTLIKSCTKKLNEVEKKVEVLVKKGGKITTEPLDNSNDDVEDNGELF